MGIDRRLKDRIWHVANAYGTLYGEPLDGQILAVLMDLRDELKALNAKLGTVSRKLPPRPRK